MRRLALFLAFCCVSCDALLQPQAELSPARQLEGVWYTPFQVPFHNTTDFCGQQETVSWAYWSVTWTITATNDPNTVLIEMDHEQGQYHPYSSNCGNSIVPFVTPVDFYATVSSSAIYVDDGEFYFNGTFTTDRMQGTWIRWDCLIFCSGEFTEANELQMVRAR